MAQHFNALFSVLRKKFYSLGNVWSDQLEFGSFIVLIDQTTAKIKVKHKLLYISIYVCECC